MLSGMIEGWEHMPDVFLTWMYLGLERVMLRSGGSPTGTVIVIPESIMQRTRAVWADNDFISMFFEQGGMFTPGGSTIIATPGLHQRMREWSQVACPEFY